MARGCVGGREPIRAAVADDPANFCAQPIHTLRACFMGLTLLALLLASLPSQGQEWRSIKPIASAAPVPAGAQPVEGKPVPTEAVQAAAQQLAKDWNNGNGGDLLAADFYGANRHQDAMVSRVPRDAKLVLESVRGVQTVQQYETTDPTYGAVRVSTVSATLSTRLQFNDPVQGYVSVPGVNEVLLEVMEPLQ